MKNIWKVLKRSSLILMTNMRTMKMAGRNKRTPMVVFGSDTLPNKCLVGYQEKDSKTRIIRICEMENILKCDFAGKKVCNILLHSYKS